MYVPFSVFCVLFHCHRVSTQLQLNIYTNNINISILYEDLPDLAWKYFTTYLSYLTKCKDHVIISLFSVVSTFNSPAGSRYGV
jgi:hypothetical protein